MRISEAVYEINKIMDHIDELFPGSYYPRSYAVFTESGSFTVPDYLRDNKLLVSVIGGGGGGGGGAVYNNTSYRHGGGGGGYASFLIDQEIDVTPGETLVITVGSAGAGGRGIRSTTTPYQRAGSGGNGTASSVKRRNTVLVESGYGTGGQGNIYATGYSRATGGSIDGANSDNTKGGAAGTTPYFGTFGNGGKGGDSNGIDTSTGADYIMNAEAGKSGCVVISWNTYTYSDVAYFMEWDNEEE